MAEGRSGACWCCAGCVGDECCCGGFEFDDILGESGEHGGQVRECGIGGIGACAKLFVVLNDGGVLCADGGHVVGKRLDRRLKSLEGDRGVVTGVAGTVGGRGCSIASVVVSIVSVVGWARDVVVGCNTDILWWG